jgi:hypothetical protein
MIDNEIAERVMDDLGKSMAPIARCGVTSATSFVNSPLEGSPLHLRNDAQIGLWRRID